jgi:hypothetical protein
MSSSPTTSNTNLQHVDLSREQQWTLHHRMVDLLDDARDDSSPPPWWAMKVVEKLEADSFTLTAFEAWRIRQDLQEYVEEAHDGEREVARDILGQLDAAFDAPPTSVQP